MSNVEKMMDIPGGSIGGPEYIKQEQEAGMELLHQRIKNAEAGLDEAISLPESEVKGAKIRAAVAELSEALDDLEKIAA